MRETVVSILILFTCLTAIGQCTIEDGAEYNESIKVLNDLLNSLSEFNSKYNTNKHIEHICDAISFLNHGNYESAIGSVIIHSDQHIKKSREIYNSKVKGVYSADFKTRRLTIRMKIDSISFVSCELAYNMSLEMSDYKTAHLLAKKVKYFIPLRNNYLRKIWKENEVTSFELYANNNPYKLIIYHWKNLRIDSTGGIDHDFIGFENLLKSIQSNFDIGSYSNFLTQLLKDASISSTSSQDAFLECTIQDEKVHFYNSTLCRQIAEDHIFCDTFSAYLHKPEDWISESVWIECDTILNKLDAETGIVEYKKIAERSLLWWIKSKF